MVISRTPVRISLTGGGTDFEEYFIEHGGFVISTAINRYIYVIVKERFDRKIGVYYETSEVVNEVSEIKHDLVRETAKVAGLINGFDISIMSDIPTGGSGLGSSSSLTVGLLNAFYTYKGDSIDRDLLARKACLIEIYKLHKPIGFQDQYIAAYGGFRSFTFLGDEDMNSCVYTDEIKLPSEKIRELESNLLLYWTNTTRSSSDILTEQKANIETKINELDKLQEFSKELYEELIMRQNVDFVGEALNKSWLVKQQLASNINNERIENMWKLAMGTGASGGKISGAGGGGFLLLYAKKEVQNKIREALSNEFEFSFLFEPQGSIILLNIPQRRIK